MPVVDGIYIGDGVYASSDGWQIWLSTQRETGVDQIALEPAAMQNLIEYACHLFGRARVAAMLPRDTANDAG